MNKPIVKELVQSDMNSSNLKAELNKLLIDSSYRQDIQNNYAELKNLLKKGSASASAKAAASIFSLVRN
jgi:lipid A disaccharide synthetase